VHPFLKLLIGATIFTASLLAQVDLTGNWAVRLHQDWADRGPGPEIVEYLGMPINEDARAKALSYSASELASPEHQCTLYPPGIRTFWGQDVHHIGPGNRQSNCMEDQRTFRCGRHDCLDGRAAYPLRDGSAPV